MERKVDFTPPDEDDEDIELPDDLDEEDLKRSNSNDLDKIQKISYILKTQEDTRYRKLQADKLEGSIIDAEEVRDLFAISFKQFLTSFTQAGWDVVDLTVKQFGGGKEDIIDLRNRFDTIVNRSITEAKESAQQQVMAKIAQLSAKRGRGERITN